MEQIMPGRRCRRHGQQDCTCAKANIFRFVEPLALYLLRRKGSSYGYDLAAEMSQHALTDAPIDPGALYRTLRTLEANGYVVSEWDTSGAGAARRLYRVTPAGVEHLQEWTDLMDRLSHALARFVESASDLEEPAPAGSRPVRKR